MDLSAGLITAGASVQVLTRRETPGVPRSEYLGTVAVQRFAPFGPIKGVGLRAVPRLGLLMAKMLFRLLRDRNRYDVVLVSGFNFMPLVPLLAGVLTRKPCVVRPESPQELREPIGSVSRARIGLSDRSLAVRALALIRRRTARRVDRFVAISAEIRAGLESLGIEPQRIVSVPNGIDVARYAPAAPARKAELRRALNLPGQSLLLIYTGRLAATKGVMMLIEAWRELAPAHPRAHLVIVGTGRGSFDDCETMLKEFIGAHSLETRVTLTGAVANVHEYLQASDIFVFPSDYEGFSLSILEAMTAGLPLVSTRVGIAAELEHGAPFGFLVPPKDPAAFRAALATALSDEATRLAMGGNAASAVRARFSLDAEAQRYLGIFRELCAPS